MLKPLVHPASKTHSSLPKRRPPAPSSSTQSPQEGTAPPPGGLFGASEQAISDIETETERLADSEETLPELEREIGIADWIDPQTGEPAEGQSPPHLDDE